MGGIRTPSFSIGLCFLLLMGWYASAAESPDLSKIDRYIAKEPVYTSKQPLYGLYMFGPEAKTRVWAIFDKSKPDATDYDILYFDRNGDFTLELVEAVEKWAGSWLATRNCGSGS